MHVLNIAIPFRYPIGKYIPLLIGSYDKGERAECLKSRL